MYDRGWGRVVNISSVHGLRASPFKSAYVSAKHGLEGLSKVVALEGGAKGVTSNCVNPAYVRTPLVERQITDQARTHGIEESEVVEDVMLAPVAVKRLVEPEEVASLVLFLCGPASASVNGCVADDGRRVDGALSAVGPTRGPRALPRIGAVTSEAEDAGSLEDVLRLLELLASGASTAERRRRPRTRRRPATSPCASPPPARSTSGARPASAPSSRPPAPWPPRTTRRRSSTPSCAGPARSSAPTSPT